MRNIHPEALDTLPVNEGYLGITSFILFSTANISEHLRSVNLCTFGCSHIMKPALYSLKVVQTL